MTTKPVNFRCPIETVKVIDEMAEADHRDRSSMLNFIVSQFIVEHPERTTNGKKPTPKKKAGTR
jgi:predicted transcriptional regulator